MGIGEKLRNRRLELGLSRNLLAEKIHVTPSAIANYENGVSYPKPDILISLIKALKVDANYLYQDYLSNITLRNFYGSDLTPEEKDSIEKYRALSESGKHLVRMIIDEEYKRTQQEEWIEFPCFLPGVRKLHSGFLLNDSPNTIKVKKMNIVEGMDFCFQIQLDRYNPIFKKHDVIALQHAPAEHNELGLFCLNGVCYLRTLYQTEEVRAICSLNVIEPDIVITENDSFECLGKFVGQLHGSYEIKNGN